MAALLTEVFADQGAAVVAGATDAPAAGTSETVTFSSSTLATAVAGVSFFYVRDPAAISEIIEVTAGGANGSGTVTRGALGSSVVTHSSGWTAEQITDAAMLGNLTGPGAWQQAGAGHSAKLAGWFAQLANRDYARANVVCLGDSITEGMGATAAENRFCARLRDNLRARFPTVGLTGGGRGFLPVSLTGSTTFSASWVTITGGTPSQTLGYGINVSAWNITGLTLVYSLVGTSADIMHTCYPGGGTFSWQVDSGAVTNVSVSGTFGDGYITHVSLGSAGAHTLTITFVSGGAVYLEGVVEYDNDYSSGIQVHDGGWYGSNSGNWANPGSGNPISETYGAAVAALTPGLVVIMLCANDPPDSIAASSSLTYLTSVISGIRSATAPGGGSSAYADPPYPPAVLLVGVYYGTDGGGTSNATWDTYVAAMQAVAAADPLTDVLDLRFRMPSVQAATTYGLYYDGTHPDNNGHAMVADALCSFLSPV